ncbi:pimeloyl-ACP methyl ester carboxylesterase [Streptomyces canus]|uniref:alpha/beta fold hydrolase n=1 Tax=Streptomyces canus TaxID=58343 RepID=UPI00278389F0|nr:alpha/beta fold hydrolase [Streptomyces canus]MDQ0605344.1 pimeloyl-ACP methyl ester carboxylesterase [Streptomyces canus]
MNATQGPRPLPSPAIDPRDPLSPGTHTLVVQHGAAAVDQRYHVAGTGPVCVAHSGGPGIGWEYLRMPEPERSMTVVYLEPVGTGESGRLADPRDYTLATYTHFLHAVIEHPGLAEVALLGHSHGGFVAQRYALDHPEYLASLILYDTSPVTGEEFWAAAVANMQSFVQRHADERPEVTTYVAGLTTRLDRSDDEGATRVLRTISRPTSTTTGAARRSSPRGGHPCGCSRHRPGGWSPRSTSARNCPGSPSRRWSWSAGTTSSAGRAVRA